MKTAASGSRTRRRRSNFPTELIDGYAKFSMGRLQSEQGRYRQLARRGQTPKTMIVGCCDSRVSPEVIFDARPGELFVVRNVANLVPPYKANSRLHAVSAALEYGIEVLKVRNIVILGHARCGGVRAFTMKAPRMSAQNSIGRWISLISPALAKIGPRGSLSYDEYLERLEKASIVNTLDNLMTFPRLKTLVDQGAVALHGAYFGIERGDLSIFDKVTGDFQLV